MREILPSGSEGGVAHTRHPYLYLARFHLQIDPSTKKRFVIGGQIHESAQTRAG